MKNILTLIPLDLSVLAGTSLRLRSPCPPIDTAIVSNSHSNIPKSLKKRTEISNTYEGTDHRAEPSASSARVRVVRVSLFQQRQFTATSAATDVVASIITATVVVAATAADTNAPAVAANSCQDDISHMTWTGLLMTLSARALINPRVAVDLLRVAWRFRHRHWYRRFPFLPLPAMTYLRWRLYTAYGDEQTVPPAADVLAFARWIGQQP